MTVAIRNKSHDARASGMADPGKGIFQIAYSGGTCNPPEVGRYLLITTAGNLNVVCEDYSTGILPVAVGLLPLRVRQIIETSSTAAGWIFL